MMNNEEIDHDPYSHLKRDILNNVITIFHMMDQNVILRTEKLTLIVNYSLASICLHPISIGSQIRKRWVTSILRYLTKIKEGRLEIKSLIRLLNNLSHQSQESKILVFKGENISNILMKYLSYLDTLRLIITLCSGTDPSIIINGQLFNGIVNIASKYRSEEGIYALKILIIIAANSSEIRSMIYKSNFLTGENSKSSPILFEALDPKGFKKKRSKYLILTLDLLLTVTSFQDGQIYVPSKCQGVMDYLLLSLVRNRNDIVSIAILRNISFHSSNRARMLFCKNFLLILRDIFLNASTLNDSKLLEICFQIVWSICHNSLKAKGTLRNAGVTESIEDLFNRSKVHLKLNSSLICNVNKVLGI
ncbi:unnamed protein product [Lepeophtheirus salmonis]|uniref:(salmon louse) hypothetical protein n=1 Tax=Lepeophtheirus salmonis TaxID=72036 RepID=A0A7R8CG36_LEPSM|nr:unnamed protein product [Lepeophtheirus salmonis]CAF2812407.1 unnamed protein product [Lepeophtheirus salmonis]